MSSDVVDAAEPALRAVTVLAHGGGAPEVAMIGLPLVLFAVFIYLEKRARAREKDDS